MHFDQLSGAASTQKLFEILFQPFSTFFVHFKPFAVISRLKSPKKRVKNENVFFFGFCLLLKAGQHEKAGLLPAKLYFSVDFFTDYLEFKLHSHTSKIESSQAPPTQNRGCCVSFDKFCIKFVTFLHYSACQKKK